jgi:hypothetical protein
LTTGTLNTLILKPKDKDTQEWYDTIERYEK